MNILYGLYQPDEGEIIVRGRAACRFTSPSDAIAAGIGMVHQHFMLVPVLHRRREHHAGRRDRCRRASSSTATAARRAIRPISEQYGLAVDPDA